MERTTWLIPQAERPTVRSLTLLTPTSRISSPALYGWHCAPAIAPRLSTVLPPT